MANTIKDEFQKKLGQKLRELREAKGLSLREVDAALPIDHSHIGKIERGEVNLTAETISQFIKYYQIQPDKLFDFRLDKDIDQYL